MRDNEEHYYLIEVDIKRINHNNNNTYYRNINAIPYTQQSFTQHK